MRQNRSLYMFSVEGEIANSKWDYVNNIRSRGHPHYKVSLRAKEYYREVLPTMACTRDSARKWYLFQASGIDRFHMTSRRPYLCTKQWIGGHVCVQKHSVGIKLFSPVKTFFYSKQFAKLLTTWLKTIYMKEWGFYLLKCMKG